MPTPPISLLESTPSTNDLALAAAHQGAPHGSCWVADTQTKGRGRRAGGASRPWHSPPGCNLYLSLLVRPDLPAAHASRLTLAAAVALRQALWAQTQVAAKIKWPNDLLIEGKKVAGILTEGIFDGPRFIGAVIGIGVNVNSPAKGFPPHLDPIATTLAEHAGGAGFDRLTLALEVRRELLGWMASFEAGGLEPILEAWRPHDASLGRRVEALGRRGKSLGIGPHGGLMVAFEAKEVVEVESGEVLFLQELP